MSEPSSAYARVRLSKAAFAAFLASVPARPNQYPDWIAWLATSSYSGTLTQADIDQMGYDDYDRDKISSVGAILDLWLNAPHFSVGESRYDNETQTWTFGNLDGSENYRDFIVFLTILRGVAYFKDLPGEDFILIFPFFWGGPPEAYVLITPGSSRLVAEAPEAAEAEATEHLQKIYETLQSAYSDSDA